MDILPVGFTTTNQASTAVKAAIADLTKSDASLKQVVRDLLWYFHGSGNRNVTQINELLEGVHTSKRMIKTGEAGLLLDYLASVIPHKVVKEVAGVACIPHFTSKKKNGVYLEEGSDALVKAVNLTWWEFESPKKAKADAEKLFKMLQKSMEACSVKFSNEGNMVAAAAIEIALKQLVVVVGNTTTTGSSDLGWQATELAKQAQASSAGQEKIDNQREIGQAMAG